MSVFPSLKLSEPPTPDGLYFLGRGADGTSVTLGWGEVNPPHQYLVCYAPDGLPGMEVNGDNSREITALDPATEYIISVSSYAGAGQSRVQSDKVTRFLRLGEVLISTLPLPAF